MSTDDQQYLSDDELWAMLAESQGLERVDVLFELAERASARGDEPQAITLVGEAEATANAADDAFAEARAVSQQGVLLFRAAEYAESAGRYQRAAGLFASVAKDGWASSAHWGRADALRAMGDFEGWLAASLDARASAESEGDLALFGNASLMQARALYYLDREDESLQACQEARDAFRQVRLPGKVGEVDDFAITVLLYVGGTDSALDLARGCVVLARESSSDHDDAYARRRLSEVHQERGETGDALTQAEFARELYRERGDLLGVARCERLRARALTDAGRDPEALVAFVDARVLFDAHGMDYDALGCDVWRSVVLHNSGDYAGAARVNRRLIDEFGMFDNATTDRRWSAVRLLDNLHEAGRFDECVTSTQENQQLWGETPPSESPSYRSFLGLAAAALEVTDRPEDAAELADQVIASTPASQATRSTALCYEVRGRARLEAGEPGGSQDLAHAIAVHLAKGDERRARELSAHFLPEDAEPTAKVTGGKP